MLFLAAAKPPKIPVIKQKFRASSLFRAGTIPLANHNQSENIMRLANPILRNIYVLFVLCLVLVNARAQETATSSLRIYGAWVRPAETMSAAYVQITNDGTATDTLVAVISSAAITELHETRIENNVARMRPVTAVLIPAGETVRLEPGGIHIMLMGLPRPLLENDTLYLTLHFASGIAITVGAWVSPTPIPYELPTDDLTQAALAAAAHGTYVGQVAAISIQTQDFVAPSSDAALTRLSDTAGKWRVIFFGYMHCPDFCPLTLVEYRKTKVLLGTAAQDVQFMFISVDAVRDTPAALRRYLDNFDVDFVGFSPDDTTLSRIQPDYGFYYQRRLESDGLAVYSIDHSTRSYLLDRDGVLRASFAYGTSPQMIADALLWYLANE